MIRIMIAEDHHLVRAALKAFIQQEDDVTIVGEAADGQETLQITERLSPDILILDIGMPKLNGIEILRRITELKLNTRVIILTMYSDSSFIKRSFQYGAKGYLLKNSVSEELLMAIRAVYRGEIFLSSAISRFILDDFLQYHGKTDSPEAFDSLSPREVEVLQLIAEGHTNSVIAQMLFISTKTVDKHRANLITKLNVRDTAGLIRLAIKNKLVLLE
ncbi:MAG TPA: DNA-binding response regulator [Firmicutes bacterium]|jgi:DNA-binding NarL/FixJ family response regulator|nr:DNA-binding response regulator [Bacillota bacterium]